MSKKSKPKAPATRVVTFKCVECGAAIDVKLKGSETTPSRVDCPKCGTRDSAVPA